jgi:hypothetical protein
VPAIVDIGGMKLCALVLLRLSAGRFVDLLFLARSFGRAFAVLLAIWRRRSSLAGVSNFLLLIKRVSGPSSPALRL